MYPGVCIRLLCVAAALCLWCCHYNPAFAQTTGHIDSLVQALSHTKSDTGRANMLLTIAAAYKSGEVTKEFYYANAAQELSAKIKWDRGQMLSEELIGDCYTKVNGYNEAITHFKSGIILAKKLNRADVEARCHQSMALCYRGLHETQQMLQYQQTALSLAQKVGEPAYLCRQMRTYGLFLSEAGRYHEAITAERRTIDYAKAHFQGGEQKNLIAELLNIIAGAYIKIDGADSALSCLRAAAALAAEAGNLHTTMYINSTFCDVYATIGKYDSAIVYGEMTIRMGEAENNLDVQQYYTKMLSRIYEDYHQPLQALVYHKKYDSLMALINNTQKKVDLALQVSKINIDQEEQRNTLEKKSMDAIRRNQQAALTAAAVAMLALVALTIFIYYNLRQKQKANSTISRQAANLQEQNGIIEKALREKEVLLKETHHRVKNNLQLISSLLELQVANLQDENAKSAIRAAQNRVLSIASVHSELYGSDEDESIELSEFINNLFTRLHTAFGNRSVRFHNEIPVTHLPLNTIVLLGLILNELITNSFKHAFTQTTVPILQVSLTQTRHTFTLSYHDNGPGLPEGKFESSSGSLGLYLVRRLGKQLKGSVAYKYNRGSIFTIDFPHAGG